MSRPVAVERPTAAPRRTLGLRPSTPADRTTRWPCPAELQIEARRTVPPADGDAVGVRDCSDFTTGSVTAVGLAARTGGAHDALNRGRSVGTITPGA